MVRLAVAQHWQACRASQHFQVCEELAFLPLMDLLTGSATLFKLRRLQKSRSFVHVQDVLAICVLVRHREQGGANLNLTCGQSINKTILQSCS